MGCGVGSARMQVFPANSLHSRPDGTGSLVVANSNSWVPSVLPPLWI